MLRSHRLVRAVHRQRVERRARADGSEGPYDAVDEVMGPMVELEALRDDGLLDVEAGQEFLVAFHDCLAGYVAEHRADVARAVGVGAAEVLFEGRGYHNRLDGAKAEACAAIGAVVVEERVHGVICAVLRELALVRHEAAPAWPAAYADRRGGDVEASDAVAVEASPKLAEFP